MGRTFSIGLAHEGAKVAVCSHATDPGPVVNEIKAKGGQAIGIKVDVRDEESTKQMAAKTKEAFGRIDVLVANAGIYGQLKPQPFENIDPTEWDWVMAVNLKGPFLSARGVLPYMREQKKGNIYYCFICFLGGGETPLYALCCYQGW